MPVAVWCLVTVVVACRAAMGGLGMGGVALRAGLACVLGAAAHGVLVAARDGAGEDALRAGGRALAWCAACACLACAVSLPARGQLESCVVALEGTPVSSWEFVVTGDPSAGEWSYSCMADAVLDGRVRGRVLLSCDRRLERGQRVRCVGRFSAAGDDEWGHTCQERGICGSVRVVSLTHVGEPAGPLRHLLVLRFWLLALVEPSANQARALMAGIVLGHRGALGELGVDDDFSRAGLAHLVAVSGAHITLVTCGVAAVLERLGCGLRTRVAALVGVSGAYVLLCGAPASAVRAWCMSVAAWGASLAGRRGHATSAMALAGIVMCLAFPGTAGELGFGLSVLCVGGLCLLGDYAGYVLESVGPREAPRVLLGLPGRVRRRALKAMGGVRRSLASSLVAQASSIPLVASAFGRMSLVGPIACLVVGPLFSLCMGVGLAACTLCGVPVAGDILLACSDACCGALLALASVAGRIPVACVPVAHPSALAAASVAFVVVLLVWWPDVSARPLRHGAGALVLAVACWQLWWAFLAPARVVVLDVGQGDAILVQDGPHTLLVDAGPDESCAAALFRNHVTHLDAVLVTHLHDDHYAGLEGMVGMVAVDEVLVARGAARAAELVLGDSLEALGVGEVGVLGYGDVLRVGRFQARVVWPRQEVDGSENAHSVELVLSFDDGGRGLVALLTGDAEHEQTSQAILAGDVGDIDLLKVGHHGSEVSLDATDAQALAAELAIASAGAGNSYGHPTPECVEVLVDAGSAFLCTKDVGDVDVRPGRDGPVVRVQRGVVGY